MFVGNYFGCVLSFMVKKMFDGDVLLLEIVGFLFKNIVFRVFRETFIFRFDFNGEDFEGYVGVGLYEFVFMYVIVEYYVDYVFDLMIWDYDVS